MRRRDFIAGLGGVAASALARGAGAQPPAGRVYHIGVLETLAARLNAANYSALLRGLRELGYIEGQNLKIDYRSGDGRVERFAALAAELVGLKVDLIVTRGTPAAMAAKAATSTI